MMMRSTNSAWDGRSTGVQVVGSFPPPVVGQAVVTQRIVDELRQSGPVITFDWFPNLRSVGMRKFVKAFRSAVAPFWVIVGRIRGYRTLYTIGNHGFGLFYNLAVILVGRCLGCRCVLHHHAVSYLHDASASMRMIDWAMGPEDCHVVLGPEMESLLRHRYAGNSQVRVVSNGFIVGGPTDAIQVAEPEHPADDSKQRPFAVGHLTNLSESKGLDLVLDAFRELLRDLPSLKLVIGGPASTAGAARLLAAAQTEFGNRLDYRGAVYGEQKQAFFDSIDVMLYPSRDDAQPLVVLESLSFGKPTIATSVGCIPSMIGVPEWLVATPADFVPVAVELVREWAGDGCRYSRSVSLANAVAKDCIEESRQQLSGFCTWMFEGVKS